MKSNIYMILFLLLFFIYAVKYRQCSDDYKKLLNHSRSSGSSVTVYDVLKDKIN